MHGPRRAAWQAISQTPSARADSAEQSIDAATQVTSEIYCYLLERGWVIEDAHNQGGSLYLTVERDEAQIYLRISTHPELTHD